MNLALDDRAAILDIKLDDKMGLDVSPFPLAGSRPPLDLRDYWAKRSNDRIYFMALIYATYFCRRRNSVADIGCHCSPLVLMVPGFRQRFAVDPSDDAKKAWANVDGATYINSYLDKIDINALTGDPKFDLILCNQVIEHLDDPTPLCHEMLEKSRRLIISTTFETPFGHINGHVQDPINYDKFLSWFPRKPIMATVSHGPVGGKIIAVF